MTVAPVRDSARGAVSHHATPVYRRMLAGGEESLDLGWRGAAVLVALGVAVGGLAMVLTGTGLAARASTSTGAIVAALVGAMLGARWLGRRMGLWIGLAMLTNAGVWLGLINPWTTALAGATLDLFARSHVPGRLPCDGRRRMPVFFFAALAIWLLVRGPAEPMTIFFVCVAYLAVGQDTRGLGRFLFSAGPVLLGGAWMLGWLGLGQTAVFGWPWSAVAAGTVEGSPSIVVRLAVVLFPWTPFAIVAILIGLRQGHYATPIWRLVGCWALVPLLAAWAGLLGAPVVVSLAWSGVAILAAAGVVAMFIEARRVLRYGAMR